MGAHDVTLTRLFIYPIKSTAPVELTRATVGERGLEHDRRYVVTDAKGRFFTARRFPAMVRVFARVVAGGLDVSADGHPPLAVRESDFPDDYDDVRVWRDVVAAQRCGAEADAWFSRYLGTEARLYYMGPRSVRTSVTGGEVSFADSAPLLLVSESSVADLNTRLAQPVGIRNFRPNVVVAGAPAFAEDGWRAVRCGGVELVAHYTCTRCILTTVDPDTGAVNPDREPLKTLLDFRRGDDGEAHFGVNVGARSHGTLETGIAVTPVPGPMPPRPSAK